MNSPLIETILGANWRTTLFGWISRIFSGVVTIGLVAPELLYDTLGPVVAKRVMAWCALIAFITGMTKDRQTKDKDVSGTAADGFTVGAPGAAPHDIPPK